MSLIEIARDFFDSKIFMCVWCIYICTIGLLDTLTNIRVSNITETSFVLRWDEVDDADQYFINWRNGNGSVKEATTSLTSHTITELVPNTTYDVTITVRNSCGRLNSSINITTTTIPNFIKLLSMILPTTSSAMQQSCTCSLIQLIGDKSGNVYCM